MNKVLSILVALFGLLSLSSCGDNGSTDEETETPNGLIGNWCYSEENSVYTIEFHKDGAGSIHIHTYELINKEHKWKETRHPFIYTLNGNQLTASIDHSETLSATIGITGNSLSITNNDLSILLTRYSNNAKIEELKKDIEENWLDMVPDDEINEDEVFSSEQNILMATSELYARLREYEFMQLNLENIRITGKDLLNRQSVITPQSSEISKAWTQAYSALNFANIIIHAMDRDIPNIDAHIRMSYKNEALALRSILYYNISHLWGHVPYISKYAESIENSFDVSIYTHKEICEALIETLKGIGILPQVSDSQKKISYQ